MLFAIVPTHTHGKRRSKGEMAGAEPWTGILTIDQMEKNSSGRPLMVANLKDPLDRHGRSLTAPLLDAHVVKVTAKGMHL